MLGQEDVHRKMGKIPPGHLGSISSNESLATARTKLYYAEEK